MKLSRSEYVAICQQCTKSAFDKKKGVICSLTNEHADFEDECKDFSPDQKSIKRAQRVDAYMNDTDRDSFDSVDSVNRSTLKSGVAFMAIGYPLLVIGSSIGLVMLLSIALVIVGKIFVIIAIVGKLNDDKKRGISNKKPTGDFHSDDEIY